MITAINLSDFKVAEPAISENAFKIHYEQHYLKYIKNAQELTNKVPWKDVSSKDIIKVADVNHALHHNVAQVYNHEFFFEQFTSDPTKLEYCEELMEYYNGSIGSFKQIIIEKSLELFGNGYLWVWLFKDTDMFVFNTYPNDQTPIKAFNNIIPILNIDLWEHSYYLDYQSDKKSYVENVLDRIDWKVIENRLPPW